MFDSKQCRLITCCIYMTLRPQWSTISFTIITSSKDISVYVVLVYIPTEQIQTASIFFSLPINKKSSMAATDKPKSSFRYNITNCEHKNTKSMSFVVSNPR